jgi:hypothetical protein
MELYYTQYTTVKHSQQLFEHTYTSDPHGLETLTSIELCEISSSHGGEYDVQSCLLGYTAV